MKFKSSGLWILLGLLLLVAATPHLAAAQGAQSSCRTCHELEAKNPVSAQGEWHIQHNFADLCQACHAGDPKASDQDNAHKGILKNPMANAEMTCGICHGADYQSFVDRYLPLIPTSSLQDTTTSGPPPAERPSPSATAPPGTTASTASPPTPASPTLTPGNTPLPAGPVVPPPANGAVAPTASSGINWFSILRFTRGPLFQASLLVFAVGMLLRLFQILRLGWKPGRSTPGGGGFSGVALSFLKSLVVLPFIPWIKGTFRQTKITFIAGGLFHLGLLTVVFLSKTHMQAWKGVLGFGWPVLPGLLVDWLAAIGIVSMLVLLVNRLVNPLLRMISGPAEWLNWLFVFLPMLTGFILAQKLWLPYEIGFSLHMALVDFLLIWIPLSRISHFIFYFFSRAIHGAEFERGPAIRL